MKTKTAIVKYKEVNKPHTGTTTYIGTNITIDFIIDWYGLNNDDIEWYEINIDGQITKSTK